jgi:hypothetical protein
MTSIVSTFILAFDQLNFIFQPCNDCLLLTRAFLCNVNVGFCTECGGGGRFRTGKWHPKEFFKIGKKSCLLSHIRIGTSMKDSETIVSSCRSAGELSSFLKTLQEHRAVYDDCLFAITALPEVSVVH